MSVLPSSIVEGKFDVSDRGLLVGTEFAQLWACKSATASRSARPAC